MKLRSCAARLVVMVTVGAAAFVIGRRQLPLPSLFSPTTVSPLSAPFVHRDTGPTLDQVRRLASLVTTKVEISDVTETSIDGYTGGVKAVLIVRGDVLLGVDLHGARFESKDEQAKVAVLVLPPPKATSPRLDHSKTKLFLVSRQGLWQVVPGDGGRTPAINLALGHAQEVITSAGNDPRLRERARQQVEQAITCLFAVVGWRVEVRWDSVD